MVEQKLSLYDPGVTGIHGYPSFLLFLKTKLKEDDYSKTSFLNSFLTLYPLKTF